MLSDGTWTYTWEHGRQLKSATNGTTSVSYKYNADGMRISKTVGSTTTKYYYVGSQLVGMTQGNDTLYFTYDALGPSGVKYNGTQYYYTRSAQGNIISIVNTSGTAVVNYTYDGWGKLRGITGDDANTLGVLNPLRYCGYVYDTETGLYYLQTRYYNPTMCRFISADGYTTTGQGTLGTNMYAYCNNNPVNRVDPTGDSPWVAIAILGLFAIAGGVWGGLSETKFGVSSENNENADKVLTTKDRVWNITVGAFTGLMIGGAALATIGAAAVVFAAPATAEITILAATGNQVFALGAAAYNIAITVLGPLFGMEIEPIEVYN